MPESHYNKKFKHFARELRNNSTDGEIILWKEVLRARQMYGYQFNRQFAIDKYIVDFICRKLKLIIEVDGYSHQFKTEKDKLRDRTLNTLGYHVLRIDEYEIKKNLNNVIRVIAATIEELEENL
ncbi:MULTISPECIES: endonuclease domain-containing protein [unclassified Carboxylicivirga]|uniref:endonuclease domain-containing protein n=1 Tax=Carboxylicivirga TaxID=1628153 RepID=UPI003D34DDCF